MKKVALYFLIVCIASAVTLPSFAAEAPAVYGETVTVQAGSEVEFPVYISGNPGLSSFRIVLSYDTECLAPKLRDDGTLWVETGVAVNTGMLISNTTKQGCQIWWSGNSSAVDGVLMTLRFVAAPHASGKQTVSISCIAEDTLDSAGNSITLECHSGAVSIEKTAMIVLGTAYGFAGETVVIPVELRNNPGFATAVMTFSYDTTALELTAIRKGTLLSSESGSFSRNVDAGKVAWFDSRNTEGDGVLFELEFTVLAQTDHTETTVSAALTNDSAKNFGTADGDTIPVHILAGAISNRSGSLLVEELICEDGQLNLRLKDASTNAVGIIIASYKDGRLSTAALHTVTLSPGNNIFAYDHPAHAEDLMLFVWDPVTMTPYCPAISMEQGE